MITLIPSAVQNLTPASAALDALTRSTGVILYIGPDQIMPLTSILGAAVGVALMFWNRLLGFAHRSRAFFSRQRPPRTESAD